MKWDQWSTYLPLRSWSSWSAPHVSYWLLALSTVSTAQLFHRIVSRSSQLSLGSRVKTTASGLLYSLWCTLRVHILDHILKATPLWHLPLLFDTCSPYGLRVSKQTMEMRSLWFYLGPLTWFGLAFAGSLSLVSSWSHLYRFGLPEP